MVTARKDGLFKQFKSKTMDIVSKIPIKPDSEVQIKKQVKQEYKFIGNLKRRKGLILFAMNHETFEIYKVKLQFKKAFDITKKKEVGTYKAQINPSHFLMYALNFTNAKRKFVKGLRVVNN